MTKEQIKSNLQLISNIFDLNLKSLISSVFANVEDIDNTFIKEFSIPEFTNLLIRALEQLKQELESNIGPFLPEQFNFQNEYGNGSVKSLLSSLKTELESKNVQSFDSAEIYLRSLIYYEIDNGFYDKSNRNVHNLRGVNLNNLKNELEIITNHLRDNIRVKEKIFQDLQKKLNEAHELIEQKRSELNQISTNVQTSNQDSKTISDLLNKSTEYSTKIDSVFNQVTDLTENAKKKISEEGKVFGDYQSKVEKLLEEENENINKLSKQVESFDEKLDFVESKKNYFEERNIYLNDLIGREVGASLFETFKQRKNELNRNLTIWLIVTGISTTALVVVLISLFWEIPENISWQYFAIRSLKSIPIVVLLYFSIRQYSKERNFQEEYAFKSSCALTIKAYADIIKNESEKDKLIVQGVIGVFKSPIYEREKNSKTDSGVLLKNMTEAVKNFSKK